MWLCAIAGDAIWQAFGDSVDWVRDATHAASKVIMGKLSSTGEGPHSHCIHCFVILLVCPRCEVGDAEFIEGPRRDTVALQTSFHHIVGLHGVLCTRSVVLLPASDCTQTV